MVISRKDLKFNVPPAEKGGAKVKLSLLVSLPTYQLASVAQSQAEYTLPHILKTEEKLRILGNVIETGIIAVGFREEEKV